VAPLFKIDVTIYEAKEMSQRLDEAIHQPIPQSPIA